jgi:hypothetical protein
MVKWLGGTSVLWLAGVLTTTFYAIDPPWSKITGPNLLAPSKRKRFRIKQFDRLFSIYLVQSLHAQHCEEVNAARARALAR